MVFEGGEVRVKRGRRPRRVGFGTLIGDGVGVGIL